MRGTLRIMCSNGSHVSMWIRRCLVVDARFSSTVWCHRRCQYIYREFPCLRFIAQIWHTLYKWFWGLCSMTIHVLIWSGIVSKAPLAVTWSSMSVTRLEVWVWTMSIPIATSDITVMSIPASSSGATTIYITEPIPSMKIYGVMDRYQ